MDDAAAVNSATEESLLGGGHGSLPPADGASASAEPMSARLARLLAHGFPH